MRLDVRNLEVTLSDRKVIHSISFAMQAGEVVGLLGPNGAGKSTLMRAIAGQLRVQGSMVLGEHDLRRLTPQSRAKLLAYLPQTRTIGWRMRVRDVVALGRLPWHAYGQHNSPRDAAVIDSALRLMDVDHLAQRLASELSGGEFARVLAARAVAQDTPFLLADEPASGLDPAHQIMMMTALRRLAAKGRMVLVSLHDLTLAARWCDRVLLLDEGRIAGDGTPEEMMQPDRLAEVFRIRAHIARDDEGLILAPTGLLDKHEASEE